MTHSAVSSAMEPRIWCRDHRGRPYSVDEFLKLTESFHGYPAPGVLVGAKMVDMAMQRLPAGALFDAVCETAKCLPDAVQLLTPCTWGNGWLKVVPLDRYAVTLFDKGSLHGVRVHVDPARLGALPRNPALVFRHPAEAQRQNRRASPRDWTGSRSPVRGAGRSCQADACGQDRIGAASDLPGMRGGVSCRTRALPCRGCRGTMSYFERGGIL